MICEIDGKPLTNPKAKYCSPACKMKAQRLKNDTIKQTELKDDLESYLGSEQYVRDCRRLATEWNKGTWGGVTRNGYTHYVTPEGVTIAISVDRKSK